MPNVPVRREQVNIGALPGVRQSAGSATPQAFGAGIGQALSGAGSQMVELANKFQEEENVLKSKKALWSAMQMAGDYENQLNELKGGDAVEFGKKAIAGLKEHTSLFDQMREKATEGLTENQKLKFDQHWIPQQLSLVQSTGRYMSQQRRVEQDSLDDALTDYHGQRFVATLNQEDLAAGMASIKSKLKRASKSDEFIDMAQQDWELGQYAKVVEYKISQGDFEGAEQFYKDHDDIIPEKDQTEFNKMINQARAAHNARGKLVNAAQERAASFAILKAEEQGRDLSVDELMRLGASEEDARGHRHRADARAKADAAEMERKLKEPYAEIPAPTQIQLESLLTTIDGYRPEADPDGKRARELQREIMRYPKSVVDVHQRLFKYRKGDNDFRPTINDTLAALTVQLTKDIESADRRWFFGSTLGKEKRDLLVANTIDELETLAKQNKWTGDELTAYVKNNDLFKRLAEDEDIKKFQSSRARSRMMGRGVQAPKAFSTEDMKSANVLKVDQPLYDMLKGRVPSLQDTVTPTAPEKKTTGLDNPDWR